VDSDEDTIMTKFANLVGQRVRGPEQEELRRRKVGDGMKDNHAYKNCE